MTIARLGLKVNVTGRRSMSSAYGRGNACSNAVALTSILDRKQFFLIEQVFLMRLAHINLSLIGVSISAVYI